MKFKNLLHLASLVIAIVGVVCGVIYRIQKKQGYEARSRALTHVSFNIEFVKLAL